jgi:integrase/recombinase XerD
VPPTRLLAPRRRRAIPYLYTREEIAALMDAAGGLRGQLHRATHRTLIGLMVVTGIRIGEAIALDRDDVDERHRLLRIIDTKFGKSREVALHDSAMDALRNYCELRDHLCPRPRSEAFFLSSVGTRLFATTVHNVFRRLVRIVGLAPRAPHCRPRMHDLRHSFAVRTLLDWHAAGVDVQARLPSLSTYLGHASPATTYYYLHAAPELLALVARRLEPALQGACR